MKRTSVNFIVDVIAFSCFVYLAATGVLIRYVLPPGSGHFSTIWGLDRHEWGLVHFWIAIVFLSALAVHLILHWSWIASVIKGRHRDGSSVRIGLALVGISVLIAVAITPFLGEMKQTDAPSEIPRIGEIERRNQGVIRGSMTLYEMEQLTGVPVNEILRKLNLPQNLPSDQQIGKLGKRYGFHMSDIREIIQRQGEGE